MPLRLRAMLVGEAWGERELQWRHAFVGPSGRELARMISEAGLAPAVRVAHPNELDMVQYWNMLRAECGIGVTNVFAARPEENDVELFFGREGDRSLPPLRPGKYILPASMPHVIRLWEELQSLEINVIVALGNSACWAVLGATRISSLRGTAQWSERLARKALPTFHPAAVLRQWSLRPIVVADLTKALKESAYPEIRRVERWITVEPALGEITAWLNRPATAYAVDIETRNGQISMIGFARNANDALVIPFQHEDGSSFWPTTAAEVQAWRLVNRALSRPVPKIFQNGIFDLSYILRMGLRPRMCLDDTMLRHHAMYMELQKSLGFLGSIYTSESAWKLMRGHALTFKRDE